MVYCDYINTQTFAWVEVRVIPKDYCYPTLSISLKGAQFNNNMDLVDCEHAAINLTRWTPSGITF